MTEHVFDAPVACTLDSSGLATQADRWQALNARAGIERTEIADGLRVRFRLDADVERELRELVAVETECCTWADWAITTGERELVLEIRSAGDGVPVIHGWFLAQ